MQNPADQNKIQIKPANPAKIRKIWMIAAIIGAITAIEFVFAIYLPKGIVLYSIFIMLTLFKAFVIVSEFMHLREEHKSLIWSLVLPCLFLVWLAVALMNEGSAIFRAIYE